MTDFELFKELFAGRFNLTDSDWGYTHDGHPWVVFRDDEIYTFFTFDYDGKFTGIVSRRWSDHKHTDPPRPMFDLQQEFKEKLTGR